MAAADVQLRGAPDALIGTPEAKSNGLQVMQLEMTQEVIDQLLKSVRSGKPPQILFGRAPQLRYGDKTHVLEASTENLRHELYKTDDHGDFVFTGVINHSLAVQTAESVTAGVDTALENLKNSMATLNQEKEARKVIVESAPSSHRRNLSSSNHRTLLKPSSQHSPNNSSPSSPMFLTPNFTPSRDNIRVKTVRVGGTGPELERARAAGLRIAILHLIAVEPTPLEVLCRLTKSTADQAKQVLEKVGTASGDGYKLVDRWYKELDPWGFPYKTQDVRQKAIDNAIRAFDRSRTPKEDPLWQKLLPEKERGQGKCLSRLKINAPTQAPGSTPGPVVKKQEKKDAGPVVKKADLKKVEAKKTDGKRAGAANGEDGEKKVKEPVIRKVTKKTVVHAAASAEPTVKKEVKRAVKKPAATGTGTAKPPAQKAKKEAATANKATSSALAKSPSRPATTKPKTPSPLSASPPVNASDFEEDHPVHKALSAAASPAKTSTSSDRPLKRKPQEATEKTTKMRKAVEQERTPVNGFKPGTNGTPSSTEKKRKATDSERTDSPQKKRHLEPLNTTTSRPQSNTASQKADTSTSPSSSSPTSPPLPLTYPQSVALSQKFQIYYEKYHKLYMQLAQSPVPPTKQQRDELMRKHMMLVKMKEEIRAGAMRQHH